jgi:C_GCAxxG_C_C family probable redox protein
MLAVGEAFLDEVGDQTLRMTSGLGGGIGSTLLEPCGAFTSGVLLIGALHGRTSSKEDDSHCTQLTVEYRDRFIHQFGTTQCQAIRSQGYGAGDRWPCSALVEWAAHVLVETLLGNHPDT